MSRKRPRSSNTLAMGVEQTQQIYENMRPCPGGGAAIFAFSIYPFSSRICALGLPCMSDSQQKKKKLGEQGTWTCAERETLCVWGEHCRGSS